MSVRGYREQRPRGGVNPYPCEARAAVESGYVALSVVTDPCTARKKKGEGGGLGDAPAGQPEGWVLL